MSESSNEINREDGIPVLLRQTSFARSFFQSSSIDHAVSNVMIMAPPPEAHTEQDFCDISVTRSGGFPTFPGKRRSSRFSGSSVDTATRAISNAVLSEEVPVHQSRPVGRRASTSRRVRNSMLEREQPSEFESSADGSAEQQRSIGIVHGTAESIGDGTVMDNVASTMPLHRSDPTARRQSWYQDALRQGLSREQIADLFGLHDDEVDESSDQLETNQELPEYCNDKVMDQHRILALHEARRLVQGRIGSIEVARPPIPPSPQTSVRINFPVPKPEPVLYIPEPLGTIKSTSFPPKRLELPKPRPPPPMVSFLPGRFVNEQDVVSGYPDVRVLCQGCGKYLAVGYLAILVKCPGCSQLSPTTTSKSTAPKQWVDRGDYLTGPRTSIEDPA